VLEPLLAEGKPEISKDGLIITLHLKHGVLWHDGDYFPAGKGRELVAGDFLYAWKRLALPELESPGTWIFDGKVAGWDDFRLSLGSAVDKAKAFSAPLKGFEAPDDYTLRVRLIKPYLQFPHVLAMPYTAPLPHEIFDKYGLFALNERIAGTGPYRLRELVRGTKILLEKNPSFRGELYPSTGDDAAKAMGLIEDAGQKIPLVEEVTFQVFKEDEPRWLSFLRGFLDVSGIPKDNFSSVVESGELREEMHKKGIQFFKMEQGSVYFLFFNMKDPILGRNAKLRKAISMALDRDAFVERFRNGRGVRAGSLVPRTIPGHTSHDFPYVYDLEKARRMLLSAGYPEGKGLPTLRLDLKGTSTNFRQQGEFIASALSKIGIHAEVIPNTMPGYLEKERTGNLQFTFGVWDSDYPDAENFLALLYSKNASPGPNICNFSNSAYDRLYERIATMEPSNARTKAISEAEDIVFSDVPLAPLFYPLAYSVAQGWVKNFRPNIQVVNHMKYFNVDLKKKAELASP
jgi:ABC-type transport system substrate-binding protein